MTKASKGPIGYTVQGVIGLAGGYGAVAKVTGVTIQSIKKWRYIPSWHAQKVAIAAGLPLAIVRPDMVQESAAVFDKAA